MQPPVPDDADQRARARQWRFAQLNLAIATFWLGLGLFWWFVDDATWQAPLFTVLGVGLLVAALSNLRQQQRNRRRGEERENPG